MKFRQHLAILALLLWPLFAIGAACEVPHFENFIPEAVKRPDPRLTAIEIGMQPVATLRIPDGFTKWGSLPDGSIVFGRHPSGIAGGIGYETRETVAVHRKGVAPSDFVRAIFYGLDETGCTYLKGQKLAQQDYRLHASLGKDAELFAFGTGERHHFYIVRGDQPDFVLNGLIKGISRSEFESILSTIQLQ